MTKTQEGRPLADAADAVREAAEQAKAMLLEIQSTKWWKILVQSKQANR